MTTESTTSTTTTFATRHDGWTMEKQLAFLEALAAGGNVTRAAATVGKSAGSAYRLRGRLGPGDIFTYGWNAALAMAYHRMRELALDRIDHGVAAATVYKGEVVASKTRVQRPAADRHARPPEARRRRPRRSQVAGRSGPRLRRDGRGVRRRHRWRLRPARAVQQRGVPPWLQATETADDAGRVHRRDRGAAEDGRHCEIHDADVTFGALS